MHLSGLEDYDQEQLESTLVNIEKLIRYDNEYNLEQMDEVRSLLMEPSVANWLRINYLLIPDELLDHQDDYWGNLQDTQEII